MRIWITRALPEAEATAERLKALGHAPVLAPVLEVQPLGGAVDLKGVAALAFTSRNGVRAFAGACAERGLKVFAVGDATAGAAREAGFANVSSASDDVAALAELIASTHQKLDGEVLYLAPEDPAGDLAGALAARGVPARTQVVYRTVPAQRASGAPADIDVVLIHSAKAARRLADDPDLRGAAASITAICISAAAAGPLAGLGFREVLVAPAPKEAAMLRTLDAWVLRKAPGRLYPPMFWVAITFCLTCIVAAVLVAVLGPRLFPPRDAKAAAQPLQIHGNSG